MDKAERKARAAGVDRLDSLINAAITADIPGNVAFRIGMFWESVRVLTLDGDDTHAAAITADLQLWLGKAGLIEIREYLDRPRWWLVN